MKIAIYTITKNEQENIPSFIENTKDADGIFIIDTGSTDNTVEELKKNKVFVIKKQYKNFRFDTAYNDAIKIVPDDFDVLISLDLDERLVENWRELVENATKELVENKEEFICYHQYVNSWKDEEKTIPGIIYNRNKIHSKSIIWNYPVFCQTFPTKENTKSTLINEIVIKHYQKERQERNPLYEQIVTRAIVEEPKVADHRFSYAEMLYGNDEYYEAAKQWIEFLNLADPFSREYTGVAQRRALAYIKIAQCQNKLKTDNNFQLEMILRASGECPYFREVWVYLAQAWANVGGVFQSTSAIETARSINDKSRSLVIEEWCWDEEVLKEITELAFKNDPNSIKR